MKITAVQKQKKNEARFSVFIDGEFSFGIDGVDLLYYKLKEGMELSPSLYDEITERVIFTNARETALRFLNYGRRSEKQLAERLERDGFAEHITDNVISLVKKYGYIDDKKYAEDFIFEMIRKNTGKNRIFQELVQKGISRDIISECLEEAFGEDKETDLAFKAIEKRMRGDLPDGFKEERRLFDFLARRGFSYDTIKEAYRLYKEELKNQ